MEKGKTMRSIRSRLMFVQLCLGIVVSAVPLTVVQSDSLYKEESYESLVSDNKGKKKGDIVTVMIYESTTASTSTGTDAGKSSDIGLVASDGTNEISGSLGVSNGFDGGGTSSHTGKLIASVSVTVRRVMENGDMIVSGEQSIQLNEESQLIKVKGRVRADDISPDNTVLSSRLADAQIALEGEGLLVDKTKPGVITKLINWLF